MVSYHVIVVFDHVYLVICFVMIIFNKYIILCVIRDVMIFFTIAFMMSSDPVYFWFYVCEIVSVELRIGIWAAH